MCGPRQAYAVPEPPLAEAIRCKLELAPTMNQRDVT
jgi:hypothetical protein